MQTKLEESCAIMKEVLISSFWQGGGKLFHVVWVTTISEYFLVSFDFESVYVGRTATTANAQAKRHSVCIGKMRIE